MSPKKTPATKTTETKTKKEKTSNTVVQDLGDKVQIGKVVVTKRTVTSQYVPGPHEIINSREELEILAHGIVENMPVLLVGDTGTGKTSLIRHLANKTNNGFRRLNLNGSTTTEELLGHYALADNNGVPTTQWIKGVLVEALEQGDWLLLDELNAALPEVLFVLQSLLDDDRMVVVSEHHGEIIRPHTDFRIFATMNPSMEYAGTKDLNKALLSRFPIVIQTHYPDPIQEVDIVKLHAPKVGDTEATLMVRIAEDVRKSKKEESISFILSTRELINWAKLTTHMDVKEAARLAVLNKCEIEEDRQTVEDILKLHFGRFDSKQIMSLADIEKQVAQAKAQLQKYQNNDSGKDGIIRSQQEQIDQLQKLLLNRGIDPATASPAKFASVSGSGYEDVEMEF